MDIKSFSTLLTSATPPSPHQLASIRREIEFRTDKIDDLLAQAQQLQNERTQLKELLGSIRLRFFPPEILSDIFQSLVDDAGSPEERAARLTNICLVSRSWREIAVETPQLWSEICVYVDGDDRKLDGIETWIERAKGAPKYLEFDGTRDAHNLPGNSFCCPLVNPRLARILANTSNVQHANLKCRSAWCLQSLLVDMIAPLEEANPAVHWRALKSLELQADTSNLWNSPSPDYSFLKSIPPVTSLYLCFPAFWDRLPQDMPALPNPDFSSVTNLTISCKWDLKWVSNVLATCKRLTELTIDCYEVWKYPTVASPHATPNHVVLPNVRKLALWNAYQHDSLEAEILRVFTMPSLEELDFTFNQHDPDESLAYLHDIDDLARIGNFKLNLFQFLERSGRSGNIKRLRLQDLAAEAQDLEEIICAIPSVEHLILDHVLCDSSVFSRGRFNEKFLTNLQILEILNANQDCKFNPSDIYMFYRSFMNRPENKGEKHKLVLTVQRREEMDWSGWCRQMNLGLKRQVECDVSVVDSIDY